MIKQSIYNLSCGPCGRIPRNHFVVLFLLEMKGTEKRLLHLSLLIVMGPCTGYYKGGRPVCWLRSWCCGDRSSRLCPYVWRGALTRALAGPAHWKFLGDPRLLVAKGGSLFLGFPLKEHAWSSAYLLGQLMRGDMWIKQIQA